MRLYHVSMLNKSKDVLNLKISPKQDSQRVQHLLDVVADYLLFNNLYHNSYTLQIAESKGWSVEKLACEAIFEYIRKNSYPHCPSRLISAYYTDSIEKAQKFNQEERGGNGAIFSFKADPQKMYYFDMDLFHISVCRLEQKGLSEQTFEFIKVTASKYWLGSNSGNTEILYADLPVLTKL